MPHDSPSYFHVAILDDQADVAATFHCHVLFHLSTLPGSSEIGIGWPGLFLGSFWKAQKKDI